MSIVKGNIKNYLDLFIDVKVNSLEYIDENIEKQITLLFLKNSTYQ